LRFVKTIYDFIRREIITENKYLINFTNNSTWEFVHLGKICLKNELHLKQQVDSNNPE
jgi:hypothetical protein